ncbi:hypothetical protein TYRP_016963 [Tyrophagus putrescentiae]|nr:hypothetical protein TYRP_016963 [Tyrophagus putrescentiae]
MASSYRPSSEWKEAFISLIDVMLDDVEGMVRAFWWLGEEKIRDFTGQHPPLVTGNLEEASNKNSNNNNNKVECIKVFAELVIAQTKEADRDSVFRAAIRRLHLQLKKYDDKSKNLQLKQLHIHLPLCDYGRLSGLAHCWTHLSHCTQVAILRFVHSAGAIQPDTAGNNSAREDTNNINNSEALATMALANLYCTEPTGNIIKKWLKEEISGLGATRRIIQSGMTPVGTGIGFCSLSLGALFGPFGKVIGEFGGGVKTEQTNVLFQCTTLNIFDGSKSAKVLEDAYHFLNISPHSNKNEVFAAWCRLMQKFHPKKVGNEENYLKLHAYMAILAAARNDLGFIKTFENV